MNSKFIIILIAVSITTALVALAITNYVPRNTAAPASPPAAAEASSDGLALRPPLEQNALRTPQLAQTHAQDASSAAGAQPVLGAQSAHGAQSAGVQSGGAALNAAQTPPAAANALSPAVPQSGNANTQALPARAPQPAAPQNTAPQHSQPQTDNTQAASQQTATHAEAASNAAPPKATPKPEATRPKEKRITGIRITPSGAGTTVRINATDSVSFKQSRLTSPERLVLDLDGVWAVRAPGVPDNALLSNVRIGKNPDRTRIVLDLKKKPARVNVVKTAKGLEIQLK